MRIALINNLYQPIAKGGAERIVEIQADLLRKNGHQVVVVTIKPWGIKLKKNDDGIFRVGGFVGSFFYLQKLPKSLRFFWHLTSWCDIITPWYISLKLAMTGCNLAIGHNLTGISLWLPRFISGYNIRYVQILHDVQYLHPSGLMYKNHEDILSSKFVHLYQMFTRLLFKPVYKIISPSEWLLDLHLKYRFSTGNSFVALPNPIFLKAENSTSVAKKIFVFVGQLERHKGIIELVQAFTTWQGSYELLIAGDGSLLDDLKSSSRDERVKFLGRLDQSSYLELMSRAYAIIVPSLCYENQPTVILEAFSQNLLVLGSNFGGTKELLQDDAGLLFDPSNQNSIINALTRADALSENELNNLHDKARTVLSKYNEKEYTNKFLSIIN